MIVSSLASYNNNKRIRNSLEVLLDRSIGILNEIKEVPRHPSDPNFYHYSGKACNTMALSGQKNFFNSGGASIDREVAIYKAIGEAIERYSSAIFDLADCPLHTCNSAPFSCADPASFNLYSEAQYNDDAFLFVPFTNDTPVRWTMAQDLMTGAPTAIPAASVYMPYTYILGEGDAPILQPISTGLACHRSKTEAVISAICEVIERDAVMIMWQAMIACPQLRIETLSDTNYEIVKRLEFNGSKVYMFDITMDHGVPTILSVLSGENNRDLPAYIFSASADPNPEKAVRKSLEELPHTRRYCARLLKHSPRFEPQFPDHANVRDQEHHLHFYCDHENKHHASFVFNNKDRKSFSDLKDLSGRSLDDTLANLLRSIAGTGFHVYLKDLTTEDVGHLGFHVCRAVIPEYQRLCMGFKNRTLGSRRMFEMTQRLGYPYFLPEGLPDNPAPHPYP